MYTRNLLHVAVPLLLILVAYLLVASWSEVAVLKQRLAFVSGQVEALTDELETQKAQIKAVQARNSARTDRTPLQRLLIRMVQRVKVKEDANVLRDVRRDLALSENQYNRIADLLETFRLTEQDALMSAASGEGVSLTEQVQAELAQLRQATRDQIGKVLDSDQRARFDNSGYPDRLRLSTTPEISSGRP